MRADTNTTIFAFASPQLLATYDYVRNAIVGKCRRNGILRSITIDEAHLFAQRGASFCKEVHYCCSHMIKAARKNVLGCPLPFYLLLSATMSLADMTVLSSMTDIGFDEPQYVIRGTLKDFAQESITMSLRIGNGYTREVDRVVTHLHNKLSSAFVFVNTRRLLNNVLTSLEGKLDKRGINTDIMNIHGKQGKSEKFALIGIFCCKIKVKDYDPRVLISTAAANLGVNHPDVQCVVNLKWPDCLASLVQRRGCASRDGQLAVFVIVVGISLYLALLRRIYEGWTDMKLSDDNVEDSKRVQKLVNTTVNSPLKKRTTKQKQITKENELSKGQRNPLRMKQLHDLKDVLRFCCLNKGCQHKCLARYLHCGTLDNLDNIGTCGKSCPICASTWSKDSWSDNFLAVSREGISIFLQRETNLRQDASYENLVKLV